MKSGKHFRTPLAVDDHNTVAYIR